MLWLEDSDEEEVVTLYLDEPINPPSPNGVVPESDERFELKKLKECPPGSWISCHNRSMEHKACECTGRLLLIRDNGLTFLSCARCQLYLSNKYKPPSLVNAQTIPPFYACDKLCYYAVDGYFDEDTNVSGVYIEFGHNNCRNTVCRVYEHHSKSTIDRFGRERCMSCWCPVCDFIGLTPGVEHNEPEPLKYCRELNQLITAMQELERYSPTSKLDDTLQHEIAGSNDGSNDGSNEGSNDEHLPASPPLPALPPLQVPPPKTSMTPTREDFAAKPKTLEDLAVGVPPPKTQATPKRNDHYHSNLRALKDVRYNEVTQKVGTEYEKRLEAAAATEAAAAAVDRPSLYTMNQPSQGDDFDTVHAAEVLATGLHKRKRPAKKSDSKKSDSDDDEDYVQKSSSEEDIHNKKPKGDGRSGGGGGGEDGGNIYRNEPLRRQQSWNIRGKGVKLFNGKSPFKVE
jgi:hypothetical protein